MTKIHDRHARGRVQNGWLDGYHTFSFGSFHDPARMGFRALRVLNDDYVIPGMGFATHPHRDMEIITYVISGEVAHRDNLGNGSRILPGEIQRMSAGTGIRHSEKNPSHSEGVHLLQIWIEPDAIGHKPSYEQTKIRLDAAKEDFTLIAGPEGGKGAVTIHQDAKLSLYTPLEGDRKTLPIARERYGFLQIIKGQITINGQDMHAGDGLEFEGRDAMELMAKTDAEMILFDLA